MSVEKYLPYRGDVKAIAATGGSVAVVTVHPEGRATGLYRIDLEKLTLHVDPLPKGGIALVADGETIWVAGDDGRVYRGSARGGAIAPLGDAFDEPPAALALLADDRLAVLVGSRIVIQSRKDGKALQSLDLSERGTALAADPTGRWIVAGTDRGTVAVFEAEDKPEFLPSASQTLHEAAVTALIFEPDELRFLSAGLDQKLLLTHARGKLEPEDKGKGANHTERVIALAWGPGDRLYSGSRDGTIKNWPRTGGARPATQKDGVGKVVALALARVHDRPVLVAACDDNTLRTFTVDAAGKLGELSQRIHDAYALARHELEQPESPRREAAIEALAELDDAAAVELIAAQAVQDADHGVRLLAAKKLGKSHHPRSAALLEPLLGHPDEPVRLEAFAGLRAHLGADNLRPLELALKAERADVGREAVRALEGLAKHDDRAFARLLGALQARTPEVRQAALASLEAVYDAASPEASLVALGTTHADVRRLALVRLHQRGLLGEAAVQSALRRSSEDSDPDVRRAAFLLAVMTRPRLLEALRRRDPELARQLAELEGGEPPAEKAKPARGGRGKAAKDAEAVADAPPDDADVAPLLQAAASRALDTSLRGARALALLGDPRAFGLLLQLSRENEAKARVEVCRALAALDDPRSIERLRSMLHDAEADVRDAAFSALAQIHQAEPLLGAESGLGSGFEDMRRRGLQLLIAELRKTPAAAAPDSPALALLVRALNDGAEPVRIEAFKAVLNLPILGGGASSLRFARRSIHADVRREVLTEVMAQLNQPWGFDLLLEFFDDPDPALRGEAFALANKKTRGLEFLEAGLGSRHADIRKQSVEALVKKHTPAAQALLVRALDDDDRDVRLAVLDALVAGDAEPDLVRALASPHTDVRLRAARALARDGNRAALAPLLGMAAEPEPAEPERKDEWGRRVESAIEGLGQLGDPSALTTVIPLLDSPVAGIRKQAAIALGWVARPDTLDALRHALPHADPEVKYHAALGLAYFGEAAMAPLVFSAQASKVLRAGRRMAAALALGAAGEDQLAVFLDDPKDDVRNLALLTLMLLELKAPRPNAARCLACLSSRSPSIRLSGARALECVSDPDAFRTFLTRAINDRDNGPAWTVAEATVDTVAELLVHGAPLTRARTARLIGRLLGPEQEAWNQAWSLHESRFADEFKALATRPRVVLESTPKQLVELAFGAYIGLVRDPGGAKDPKHIHIRQAALIRILALAREDPRLAQSAIPVLVQTLGDPNQSVRLLAFEQLKALGVDSAKLGAEALGTEHTDLGVKGLELLTGGAASGEGGAILERVMLTRNDELAIEAAKLLLAARGAAAVAGPALAAAHEPLRERAVGWLVADYADPAARALLHQALESRYQRVREAAALELAAKKDPAAYPALVKLLAEARQAGPLRKVVDALVTLGDPRTPDALLDRLENDASRSVQAETLIRAAGGFRRVENAERLLVIAEKDPSWRESAFLAVLAISGFDQPVEDPNDERTDGRWEKEQHPRNDAVLARLIERCTVLGDARRLARLIEPARWARGKAVEPLLAGLTTHLDDDVRRKAVEAYGWRLRKRDARADPLIRALGHRDPVTQFLAAEGLALTGRGEGLNVLLASLDFVDDLTLRGRAVHALGELADERALDTLLKLASEEGHALQETAAEAIGHLGRSAKADAIFALLERTSRARFPLSLRALKGLRWLNTRAAWQLIRKAAEDEQSDARFGAAELLGFDDDPATRDLLLRLLAESGIAMVNFAYKSARRLWGPESLEPAYALLRNSRIPDHHDDVAAALEDVCKHGDPARIFAIVPTAGDTVWQALATRMLGRDPLPLAEAIAALGSPDARAVDLAARVLGRAGRAAKAPTEALVRALRTWRDAWDEERRKMERGHHEKSERLDGTLTPCLRALVWASGRLGAGAAEIVAMSSAHPGDPAYRPIRFEAVSALAGIERTPAAADALEAAAVGDDPDLRAFAASAVADLDKDRAADLAGRLLADRLSFRRVVRAAPVAAASPARAAAAQVHSQGVVLTDLVAQGDVEALGAVVGDRSLPDVTRLGAIEALAAVARIEAEERLRSIGLDASDDEELRKAAWRGLRRSKRARAKRAAEEVTP